MAQSPLEYVVAHWSKLFENFNTSSDQFYRAVGAALARREIPNAPRYRIQWSEGGVLSPNREYLRIEGSGFACDICAAPFGTGFFFSWWLTRKRPYVFLFFALYLVTSWGISRFLASVIWSIYRSAPMTFDPASTALRFLLQNPITIGIVALLLGMALVALFEQGGLREPGEALKEVPIVGWLYERWFSPVTFYRLDTAAMFRAAVHAAVLEVIDDITTKKGLRALASEEREPVLDRLA